MSYDAEIVAPENVPFDVQVQDAPIKASPLEIECACMTAHGATIAEIAARFGVPESMIARLRRKPNVKLLVGRYAKDAGLAGADILNVAAVHAARTLLDLMRNGDPGIRFKASQAVLKLTMDLRKMPANQVQVNLMQGVTVQSQAMGKPEAELIAEAELAVRVAGRFLEHKGDDE